jgi:hypothetical protein
MTVLCKIIGPPVSPIVLEDRNGVFVTTDKNGAEVTRAQTTLPELLTAIRNEHPGHTLTVLPMPPG